MFNKEWIARSKAIILGGFILISCLSRTPSVYAEDIYQNLNLQFEFIVRKNPNPYCSQNYTFMLYLHWSAPPQGNVCFYMPYRNGVGMGYSTGDTKYFICSLSGCFASEADFLSRIPALLEQYYYNSTFKVVANRACYGLPNLYEEKIIGDAASERAELEKALSRQLSREKSQYVAEPINVVTGDMYTSETDILIPAKEIPLELTRTYNSHDDSSGQFGYGWRSNYEITLTEYSDASIVEEDGDGIYTVYTKNLQTDSYEASPGKYAALTKNTDRTFTVLRKHGRLLTFDVHGWLMKIQERNGNALTIARDFNGRVTEVDDSSGRKLLFTNDLQGRVTQVSDPAGKIWSYEYDVSGNLVKVTDPLNNSTTYLYDDNHKMVQKTDANGHGLYFEYDASGRAYRSWQDGNNNAVNLTYDASATTVIDSLGNATRYEYNTSGLVTRITDALNNSELTAWDTQMNKISFTDKNSHMTSFTYDDRGNLLTVTDPLNNTTTFTYEPNFDFVKTATDPAGSIITYDYDAKGNLITVTDALGNVSANVYGSSGELTSATNPRNFTTNFTYDAYGDLLTSTDALGHVTSFGYDILGNKISVTDAKNNKTQFTYDNLNRLVQIKYPDDSVLSYTYDALGNRTSVTDNAGRTYTYAYDLNDQLTGIRDPLGNAVSFSYDTEGNRIKVIDQKLHQTAYRYDALNRLISVTNPLGQVRSFEYDAAGNRIAATDAKNNRTTYEYDGLNRLKNINYPVGAVNFDYDAPGRRVLMNDSQGATSYAYDKLGRLTAIDGPKDNDSLGYTYDQMGNRTSLTLPGGGIVVYFYDALDRLSSIVDPNDNVTTYGYDEVGNPLDVIYPNHVQTTYAFDALRRLTHLVNLNQNTQEKLSEFSYTYDPSGRRSRMTLLDGAVDYGYDASGQLISENKSSAANPYQITYEYDPAGNRSRMVKNGLEHSYAYNDANQLIGETYAAGPATIPVTVSGTATDANGIASVTVNGVEAALEGNNFSCRISLVAGLNNIMATATDPAGNAASQMIHVTYDPTRQIIYTYDNNGNLISKKSTSDTLALGYDYENRLNSIASGAGNVTYVYDGDGKRISYTNGSNVINYLYDGSDVVLERNGSGELMTTYLRDPYATGGIGGIINVRHGTDPEAYYSYNGQGSVANLSDASGASVQSYTYDAFGNQLNQTTTSNSRQFLTKETDASGLVYFGARYYDSTIGRFITTDPMGMVDGPNMYLYCGNDPVDWVDPLGLCKGKKSWLNIDFDSLLDQLEDLSYSMAANPMSDLSPYPFEKFWLMGVVASKTGRVFWTGGRTAMTAAMKFSEKTGRVTLEMTKSGQRLMKAAGAAGKDRWIYASKQFAKGANGVVHFFRRTKIDPKSFWKRFEEPILKSNDKVEEIIEHIVK